MHRGEPLEWRGWDAESMKERSASQGWLPGQGELKLNFEDKQTYI